MHRLTLTVSATSLLQDGHLTLFDDSEAAPSQALQDESYFEVTIS